MSPAVTRSSRTLVRPQGETPTGRLPLSPIDKVPNYRRVIDLIQVYEHGRHPAKVIREALSLALNHYYPLAGRLVVSEDGGLEVACTGEGAWFIEASADCTLKDVNFMELPLMLSEDDVLPYPRPGIDPEGAIVMMQVTEFVCGGFTVVCGVNHVVYDGLGHGQFMKAIAEMVRRLAKPTIPPIWSRESIPGLSSPTQLPFQIPKSSIFHYSTTDVSLPNINQLKSQVFSRGNSTSSFQLLTAMLWQCWTRASNHSHEQPVEILFPVNIRPLLKLEAGYYGNCIHGGIARSTSGCIATASIEKVVDLIRDAHEKVVEEFNKDPKPRTGSSDMLVVIDYRGLGHGEVDFGWGVPLRWGPLTLGKEYKYSICVIINPPATMPGGARLLTGGDGIKEKLRAFSDQIEAKRVFSAL